jgi:hypothetical protein
MAGLLTPEEVAGLLEPLQHQFVLTVAARTAQFYQQDELLASYLRELLRFPQFTLAVVPGHPSYDDVNVQIPVLESMSRLLAQIRHGTSRPVFIGIENLPSSIVHCLLTRHHNLIPFLLHGDSRAVAVSKLGNSPLAVYSPLAVSIAPEEALGLLFGYLLRRKYTQDSLRRKGIAFDDWCSWNDCPAEAFPILEKSLDRFVLTSTNIDTRITAFLDNQVKWIIGNPVATDRLKELDEFTRVLGELPASAGELTSVMPNPSISWAGPAEH